MQLTLVLLLGSALAQAEVKPAPDEKSAEWGNVADAPAGETQAPATPAFGTKGTLSPSGEITISSGQVDGGAEVNTVWVEPHLWYFIKDRVAVGGALRYSHQSLGGLETTMVSIGPGLGFAVPLGPTTTLFPNAVASIAHMSATQRSSETGLALALDVPVLVHRANYFLGVGPRLQFVKIGEERDVALSLELTVGGWL